MGEPLHTIMTERLGCRWPIIQTAMGWVAEPSLVASGSIPVSMSVPVASS